MKKVVVLMTVFLSGFATADGFYGVGEVTHAQNSLDRDYFDRALGTAGASGLTSKEDGATNRWRLQGGYAFNDYLAVEAGYIDFGTVDYKADFTGGSAKGSLKAGGLDVAGLLSWPISRDFSVFAKVGAVAVKAKSQIATNDLTTSLDAHTTRNSIRPLLGVGATYAVYKNWDVRADYDEVSNIGKSTSTGTLTSRMFSLGVKYNF